MLEAAVQYKRVNEVGPRDSLQGLGKEDPTELVPLPVRIKFIEMLGLARTEEANRLGLPPFEIEITARVRYIPQHADALDLLREIPPPPPGVVYSVLTPNKKGFEQAMEAGGYKIGIVSCLTASTEGFVAANMPGMTIADALQESRRVRDAAHAAGLIMKLYQSGTPICPIEGPVSLEELQARTKEAMNVVDPDILVIGETTGRARPGEYRHALDAIVPIVGAKRLGVHIHNGLGLGTTNNMIAAAFYGVEGGHDGGAGGMGPTRYGEFGFREYRYGNRDVANNSVTEELVNMFEGLDFTTGLDPEALVSAAEYLHHETGLPIGGNYAIYNLAHRQIAQKMAQD